MNHFSNDRLRNRYENAAVAVIGSKDGYLYALKAADGHVKEAIVMVRLNVDFDTAWQRLEASGGRVRAAIASGQI